ncbi:MAG: DUF11 domain-containing protein [Acidobacteria bacterium]|nr:DUF11 domain-containing protein [Acidobacteriota bacterium]
MRRHSLLFLLVSLLCVPLLAQPAGTSITIVNNDGAGEGFNDPTAAAPVGGNPGTTIGEQRLIAFQFAADLWAALLDSPVPIRVEANFNPLTCTDERVVLGSAGPKSVFSGFSGQPIPDTWYVSALANRLAGTDLETAEAELTATFSSALDGDPNCAGGGKWYYGLDNNPGPNETDLVVVVLHELGHGLGFLTITDKETGEFFLGRPDIYARFLFDNTLGATWPQMTDAQRKASATNSGNLVWIGENAVAAAPSFLGPTPVLLITDPDSIEGDYEIGLASFGGDITVAGISARVVAAEDEVNSAGPSSTDACTTILNPSAIAGNIALVDRGDCTFVTKALNAQQAGAIALIIANNVEGGAVGMSGSDDSITIPVISVSKEDGATIRQALDAPARATIRLDPQNLAGTDSLGRPKMYAPDPVVAGSSVSHWDSSAEPDLLMEPAISSSLGHGVDLSRDLFADIGWYSDAKIEAIMRDHLYLDRDVDGRADPGDTVRMIVSIQNNGDVAARDVVFDLALPAGLEIVPHSVEGGTVTDQSDRLTVDIGTVDVGEEVTLTFDLLIDSALPPTSDSFELQGAISGTNIDTAVTDDPTTVEADDPTVIEISHTALRAFKSVRMVNDDDQDGEASGGDRLQYYVVITNNSVTDMSNVSFVDPIDPNLDLVPGSVGLGAGSDKGTILEGNGQGDRRVVISYTTIASGESVEIGFDVIVNPDISERFLFIPNQAEVSTAETAVLTDDPSTVQVGDPTLIHLPGPRKRAVRPR